MSQNSWAFLRVPCEILKLSNMSKAYSVLDINNSQHSGDARSSTEDTSYRRTAGTPDECHHTLCAGIRLGASTSGFFAFVPPRPLAGSTSRVVLLRRELLEFRRELLLDCRLERFLDFRLERFLLAGSSFSPPPQSSRNCRGKIKDMRVWACVACCEKT